MGEEAVAWRSVGDELTDMTGLRLHHLAVDALRGPSLAVMLYGSQARRRARIDSDVDVLQIVAFNPRSYSKGRVNVTAYTADHLVDLAKRGSLFVRHLLLEGVVLQDSESLFQRIFSNYSSPQEYSRLKGEIGVTLHALQGSENTTESAVRVARYLARTALYICAIESGVESFDIGDLSERLDVPQICKLLRRPSPEDLESIISHGLRLLGDPPKQGCMPQSLAAAAIWSLDRFPMAAKLLEAVIAGDASVNYTTLTLPMA